MLVTLSGLPGSGTTTAGRLLADALGWEFQSSGELFRSMADARGVTLAEFGALAEGDERIDRELDARAVTLMRGASGLVMEGRLAGWMAFRNGLGEARVWLESDAATRARRVADRDGGSASEQQAAMAVREASESGRYRDYYDIDIASREPYTLDIDSGALAPKAIVARIRGAL
ncbi:MAG: cytidylate kinase [Euryarchaeota archaeon]|jgi:cytidylate kinase|nr:cytidylate kinase [Euryarchaeota archaeon]MAH17001.1 cytidylate kinase [Euryarchaeota archaeon]|tara:strand:+ start:2195 stop:2716 length:522 start_codon:yes stop_codon:yes gene_type:complete